MRVLRFALGMIAGAIALAVGASVTAEFAQDDPWIGKRVVKKKTVPPDKDEVVGGANVFRIFTVDAVREDQMHVTSGPVEGWVDVDGMVLLDEAAAYFTERLREDPKAGWAYRSRGTIRLFHGEYEAAVDDYTSAIRLDPADAEAYSNRGAAWTSLGEYDRADADMSEAIRLIPRHAVILNNRGLVRWYQERYEEAVADWGTSVRLDPNYPDALNGLAWAMATCPVERLRDGSTAIKHARAACEASGWENSGYVQTLAAAYAEAGEFDKAECWQSKAVEMHESESAREFGKLLLDLYREKKPYREIRGSRNS